ncbi:MAG: zinc ribbon domain-containing protein, partial [Pedobacter sp.]
MSKCSKCGTDIKEGSGFCSKCGNKIEAESKSPNQSQTQTKTQTQTSSTTSSVASAQTETPKKKKSTGVKVLLGCLIAFVVVAVVGGIVGYILIKKGVEKAQDEIKKAEEGWSDEVEGLKELENIGED